MQLPELKEGPKFKIGDTVWVIKYHDRIQRGYVRGYDIAIFQEEDKLVSVLSGYRLDIYTEELQGCTFGENRLIASKEEAERLARRCPVEVTPHEIDTAELEECCSDVGTMRAILSRGSKQGFLIQLDVNHLHFLFERHEKFDYEMPNLDKILSQLGIPPEVYRVV
jgi:hypothetical protein